MPCGVLSPVSRVRVWAAWPAPGRSSTIRPLEGSLTSRSPSGVQASMRASGTLAQTLAFHLVGTVTLRGVLNGVAPRPLGTVSVTVDRLAAVVAAAAPPELRAAVGDAVPPQAATERPVATTTATAGEMSRPRRMRRVHHAWPTGIRLLGQIKRNPITPAPAQRQPRE